MATTRLTTTTLDHAALDAETLGGFINSLAGAVTTRTGVSYPTLSALVAQVEQQLLNLSLGEGGASELQVLPPNDLGLIFAILVGDSVVWGLTRDGAIVPEQPMAVDTRTALRALVPPDVLSAIEAGGTAVTLPPNDLGAVEGLMMGDKFIWYLDRGGKFFSILDAETAVTPSEAGVVVLYLRFGQSLSLGSRGFVSFTGTDPNFTNATVFSSQPSVYGDYCLMLGGDGADTVRTLSLDPTEYTRLEPIRESWSGGVEGETGTAEMLRALTEWLRDDGRGNVRFLGAAVGQGGALYSEIGPGTANWQKLEIMLRAAKRLCMERGWTLQLGGVDFVHGHAPGGAGTLKADYLATLMQARTDLMGAADAILGGDHAYGIMYLTQLNAGTRTEIAQAQLLAHMISPWHCLVGPKMPYPYHDGAHMEAEGYVKVGGVEAKAKRFRHALGKKFEPLRITSATWDGAKIVLRYNNTVAAATDSTVSGPVGALALDIDGGVQPSDLGHGFVIDDVLATGFQSVALGTDGTSIELVPDETPSPGCTIDYILTRPGGTVRDSDARRVSAWESAPLYNWALGQMVEVDFIGAAALAVYDPAALETVWADTVRRTWGGTAGTAVAALADAKNANHLTQATAASRPIFRHASGVMRLEFDGANDMLSGPITVPTTHTIVIAADVTTATATFAGIVGLTNGANAYQIRHTEVRIVGSGAGSASFAATGKHVWTIEADAAAGTLTLYEDGGASAVATVSTYDGSAAGATTIRFFASGFDPAGAWVDGDLYYCAVLSGIDAGNRAAAEAIAAKRAGVTLA